MVCVIVSATGENMQGTSWGRAAAVAAYTGMLKPNDNYSTDVSVGAKVFKSDQKTIVYCNVDYANKLRTSKNDGKYNNADRMMKAENNTTWKLIEMLPGDQFKINLSTSYTPQVKIYTISPFSQFLKL